MEFLPNSQNNLDEILATAKRDFRGIRSARSLQIRRVRGERFLRGCYQQSCLKSLDMSTVVESRNKAKKLGFGHLGAMVRNLYFTDHPTRQSAIQ
jgi:hypothetical protein